MRDGEIKQMRYICPECGNEIPEDSGFCYSCGRKKDNTIRLDQSGRFIPPEENKCTSCGGEMAQGDLFCPACGEPRSKTQMAAFRPKMIKYGWIGIVLALIPGTLGFVTLLPCIFGLGHFYFKKWTKGATFMLLSAGLFYITIQLEMSFWENFLFQIVVIFFFLLQAMEVFVLAFMPPKTSG